MVLMTVQSAFWSCWSQNCDTVWNTPKQGSTHNSTLQFWHLKLILVCFLQNTQHCIYLNFWGQWSLFCTLSQLVQGV